MKSKIFGAISLILIIGIMAATVAVMIQRKTVKEKEVTIRMLEDKSNYLKEVNLNQAGLIKQLGEMEAIHCEIQFVVNNKAVFGSIKNGDYSQIAEATIRYLRWELLPSDTARIKEKEVFKLRSNGELQKK